MLAIGVGPTAVLPVTAAASARGSIPVLMYHRVDPQLTAHDPITVSLTVMEPTFRAQLTLLHENGYETMTLGTLREMLDRHAPLPPHRAVLTFDDGYADNYAVVFPLLRRYGFVGTFFVVTSSVGTRDHLTVPQIREMARAGMEIESHGVHHVDFSRLPLTQARRELTESRTSLEAWTGRPVVFFAYPAGRYSTALERLLADLGYRGALTERPGFVSATSPPYLLERVRVSHEETLGAFASTLGLSAR
ncbi:MAG TPA: polysaccharide deacetylase family protein [bacterium]|nr:polysaccharide deacetylase family protein [bacterium]